MLCLFHPLFFPCYLVVSSIYLSGGVETHTPHTYTPTHLQHLTTQTRKEEQQRASTDNKTERAFTPNKKRTMSSLSPTIDDPGFRVGDEVEWYNAGVLERYIVFDKEWRDEEWLYTLWGYDDNMYSARQHMYFPNTRHTTPSETGPTLARARERDKRNREIKCKGGEVETNPTRHDLVARARLDVANEVLRILSKTERVALYARLNKRTEVFFSTYLQGIINDSEEILENTNRENWGKTAEKFLKRFRQAGEKTDDAIANLKALKGAFRRFYAVEIPQSGHGRYALGYTVRQKLGEDKQVWVDLLREDMAQCAILQCVPPRTYAYLLRNFEIFFDKPIPDLYRALFYGTGMANKAKINFDQHEYTIHLRLTTKAEDSFVAECVQKQNLKALELLQKTFEFDMKQDGYRLPRDACIRYVLFYQLRETTMKWIRTQWANFFNRLDNESFGCPADPVEQFAVNFFRKSRVVPENTFCRKWACSISDEQKKRHDEKQRVQRKKMEPTISWLESRNWASFLATQGNTLGRLFPFCWPEIQDNTVEVAITLPGFQGEVFSLDLGRIMARFPTLKAYADKRDQLEKARLTLMDPEHPLSSLVTMTTAVEKNAGYYFADLGWSVWRETVVKEKGRLPQKWRITPACLDTFLNTGGVDVQGFGSLERLEQHPEPTQKESMEWSEKIRAVRNAQRDVVLEKRGFLHCPLSGAVMKDPVVASEGYSYV